MTLAEEILGYLGNVATYLEWDLSDMTDIVSAVLEVYGVSTEAEATDLRKLHLIARCEAWRKSCYNLVTAYSLKSPVYQAAFEQYKIAAIESNQFYETNQIVKGSYITVKQDPYEYYPPYQRIA